LARGHAESGEVPMWLTSGSSGLGYGGMALAVWLATAPPPAPRRSATPLGGLGGGRADRRSLMRILVLATCFEVASAMFSGPCLCGSGSLAFDRPTGLVGYVTNLPDQPVGFMLAKVVPHAVGFCFDIKASIPISRSGADDFYENISVHQAEDIFGDRLIGTDLTCVSLNGGLTMGVAGPVAIYGGIGVTWKTAYRQYYDPFEILGEHGQYWVRDDQGSSAGPNLLGGLFARLGNGWALQIGGESNPAGVTAGIAFLIR
jgi:hypothetical protein